MKPLPDNTVEHLTTLLDLPDLDETRYRPIRRIASGGMGTVYLAHDVALGRQVALKVRSIAGTDKEPVSRMIREARVIAQLEHPGIVPVHDIGELSDGRVFYAMKFVRGERLDEWAAKNPSLPVVLRTFQKACEAVAFAHAHAVIHRDLKPENIMVGDFGQTLVMDWGLAKRLPEEKGQGKEEDLPAAEHQPWIAPAAHEPGKQTSSGTVLGTPAYMAPEQRRGEVDRLDQRTDVYALGAILRFLMAGQPATSPAAGPLGAMARARRPLRAICEKAMAPEPANRYASAQDLAADVEAFLNGLPVKAYRESAWEKAARWVANNRILVLLVLAYLLMRLIVLVATGR